MTEAFITVLTNDKYLPGALTLARALRDVGTQKKLAVLVANVSAEALELLEEVYDDIIDAQPILSTSLEQLADLGRVDLVSTYTKILVWKQTQYSKVVYLDADVLPVANIDDFFEVGLTGSSAIAASPDAGWPDIFNSGVFITTPSSTVFDDLLNTIQTEEDPSFDGGDQGLLNQYFLGKWKRLPFTYNVTPSAGYQYVPAFLKFGSQIKNVHFIGLKKPWLSRDAKAFAQGSSGKGHQILSKLHQQWWNVFNKHYFGKIAGVIYQIANTRAIEDTSDLGEGHSLDIPSLQNEWDSIKLDGDVDESACESDKGQSLPPPIFPWEEARVEAERVFDDSTDFHV